MIIKLASLVGKTYCSSAIKTPKEVEKAITPVDNAVTLFAFIDYYPTNRF